MSGIDVQLVIPPSAPVGTPGAGVPPAASTPSRSGLPLTGADVVVLSLLAVLLVVAGAALLRAARRRATPPMESP